MFEKGFAVPSDIWDEAVQLKKDNLDHRSIEEIATELALMRGISPELRTSTLEERRAKLFTYVMDLLLGRRNDGVSDIKRTLEDFIQ